MGSKVGRPRAGDSAQTRRLILQAARVRFARDGFRATTNRLIAADVGITSGAIYHYVDSKAALYADVYCDTIDELYTEFERVAAAARHLVRRSTAPCSAAPPSSQWTTRRSPDSSSRSPRRRSDTPTCWRSLSPQRGRHARFFQRSRVEAAAERGELATGLDHRALADLLGAVLTGLARMSVAAGDPARYTAAVEVLERFLDGTLLSARV